MVNRPEFNARAEAVLSFMDTYGVLKTSSLEKFLPGSEKVVSYLVKHRRLFFNIDKTYLGTNEKPVPEKILSAALGVLGDIFEKVQTHGRAVPPVQISFLTRNNEYYEIVYVSLGMEAMVTAIFETRLAAYTQGEKCYHTTKRMVIVECKSQMDRLDIPGTMRYALVRPDGGITYYRGR